MALDGQDQTGTNGAVVGRWILAIVAGLATAGLAFGVAHLLVWQALGLGLVIGALVYMLLTRLGLPRMAQPATPAPVPQAPPVTSMMAAENLLTKAREAMPVVELAVDNSTASRPVPLNAARGGLGDNLKIIKGIGPKLEQMCQRMGYFHFDQIAGWSEAEVAWVDDNLEGFKGRVSRDRWVAQAKVIAEIGPEEFVKQLAAGREF